MNTNDLTYEYCPNCDANLTLQKGYRNDLPYWICKGCGQMLVNPEVDGDSDIAWFCDRCEAMLNVQPGFNEECGEWVCSECGFANKIDVSELYYSDDEYRADAADPYKGLTDEDVLALSEYEDEGVIADRADVIYVRHRGTGERFIKKILHTYDESIYEYLYDHPISHMPHIIGMFKGANCLIVIEEFIHGTTLEEMLTDAVLGEEQAVHIAKSVCLILDELHSLPRPIIHRDVKPANIMLTDDGEVILLDMNVAKWHDPDETDDTRYLGTQYYAAPEQVGYGLSASFAKTDIYAVGMMLNVMITGCFPKEKRAEGKLWDIIERCISLDADKRYTARELIEALDGYLR